MNTRLMHRRRFTERGIALLISIFVLLLVCVVGIAMVAASGSESALTGNYHSSTAVYYAAMAGLEEGRGRVWPKGPNYINNSVANFFPSPGTPLPVGKVLYILNPSSGETVNPTDSSNPATYPDLEYDQEFGSGSLAGAAVSTTPSVSPVAGLPGGFYKWVRVNAITEKSINLDVDSSGGPLDSTSPLYFDGSKLSLSSTAGYQALEITSMAAYPNGSQKIVQYVAAPSPLNLSFSAALTFDGNNAQFSGPPSTAFNVDGNDHYPVGSCPLGPAVHAIGYTGQVDGNGNFVTADSSSSNIVGGIPPGPTSSPPVPPPYTSHYNGVGATTPDVAYVGDSVPIDLKTVAGLNSLVQTIKENADAIVPGGSLQSDSTNYMPANMSSTNPVIVYVDGDFTINAWHSTGYGILLVTGDFTYDPDASWYGIVLVIGKGYLYSHLGGTGQFNGAVFLAKTVDSSGLPLAPGSPLDSPFFNFTSTAGGNGVSYSSCWVKFVQPPLPYRVLSFHEIAQ